jgi:formylglycine-generating enzyme required for sulfatase activity
MDGQETRPSIYPETPAGSPPVLAVEHALAATPEDMRAYEERLPGSDLRFKMLPIPGGSFLMGSPESEAERQNYEGPQHKVTLSPFWIEVHEVTWDEYQPFMLKLDLEARRRKGSEGAPQDAWADAVTRPTPPYVPMDFSMGIEGRPAVCMTQFAAKQYTKWLSMKTGRFYRLPTEAEWEYACRAGTTTRYSWGDDAGDAAEYAWFFDNADDSYQPVMTRRANPWGLFDMHGNVAEWVLDGFEKDAYDRGGAETVHDPLVLPVKLYPRVVRGGSWDDDPNRLRSAARRRSTKSWKIQDPQLPKSIWYHTDAPFVGFRVVRPFLAPAPGERARYWEADIGSIQKFEDKQRRGER